MGDPSVHRARIVASAAATAISLACGTNVGLTIARSSLFTQTWQLTSLGPC